jgi:hypothetical protein
MRFPRNLSRWFGNLFTTRSSSPIRRRSPRPGLELLEDRWAPAILTVNTLDDNTTDTSVLTLREAITLVNHAGDPTSLSQGSVPSGWSSQIAGNFGTNDTILFDASLGSGSVFLTGGRSSWPGPS